jgi:hypothetical protein
MGFNFEEAFKRPTKIINDAAMQALGSYRNGKMLFLGLGTGLGSTLIADGILEPMELGHLPYKKGTYEDYVGDRGLRQFGKKQWRRHVADVVARLIAALEPTDVVSLDRLMSALRPKADIGWMPTLCHDGHALPPLQTKFLRDHFFYVENRRRASKRCFRIVRHCFQRTVPIAEAFQAIRIRK